MTMNEKTFQQILSLHSKGLGEDASLLGILQLTCGHEDHREAVKWVKKFYHTVDWHCKIPKTITTKDEAIQVLQSLGWPVESAIETVYGRLEGN